MEPITGLEPVTSSLPRKCSTSELYGRNTFGAGDGNRTHVISLEGWSSTIELHPQNLVSEWWRGEDSNLRRLSRQIYSLIPLAAREPLQTE